MFQHREDPTAITYFARTNFRDDSRRFGIRAKERLQHLYVIGKTGVGKSNLLEIMAIQDIQMGNGMAFLDPHGKTAELLMQYVPEHRINDVIYFAPFDMDHPIAFNVMEDVGADKRNLVANGILSVMNRVWPDSFSGRMEYILLNTILALLEYPDATLLGINRMLSDKQYRLKVVENITDPLVKKFWVDEFLKWDERYQREAGASIMNKTGQFLSSPMMRNIVGQPKSTFNLREAMDTNKVLIANLSIGQLGEQNVRLLGSLLSTKIYLAAMSRADLGEEGIEEMPSFYLYVDEFQNFANDSFADVLSQARKYKLSLTMAHQYIAQLPPAVRDAVFGNVGTMITFRVGPTDAEEFAREFAPVFQMEDFVNLGFTEIYLRLLNGRTTTKPFSANVLPPIPKPPVSFRNQAIAASRYQFSRPRPEVEAAITAWYQPVLSEKQQEHAAEMDERRIETYAKGAVWVDYNKHKDLRGLPYKEAQQKVMEREGITQEMVDKRKEEALAILARREGSASSSPKSEKPDNVPHKKTKEELLPAPAPKVIQPQTTKNTESKPTKKKEFNNKKKPQHQKLAKDKRFEERRPEPVAVSQELGGLLSGLDGGASKTKNKEIRVIKKGKKVESQQSHKRIKKKAPEPLVIGVESKEDRISLASDLNIKAQSKPQMKKKITHKDTKPETKNALKELLAKKKTNQPRVAPRSAQTHQPQNVSHKKRKQIPDDVLQQIFQ